MKREAGILVLVCALMSLSATASGQITFTAADANATLAVGDTLANKIDKQTDSLDIGFHGHTSWDFSSLGSDSSQTFVSVALGSTPFYTPLFPGATHVFRTDLNVVYMGNPIVATGYVYFQLSTDLLNMGLGATALAGFATLLAINHPADIFYKLPLMYGTTWTSTYVDTTNIYLFGAVQPGSVVATHSASYIVDAFGHMTIPGGTDHDALRIKKTDNTGSGTSVSYTFLALDGATVQVTALSPAEPDSGKIKIQPGSASWSKQVITITPIQLVSFNALQNPSGPGVLLRWSTLSEVNNYGFEVQRGARPGGAFATISGAVIPGHGTTTVPRDYSYADMSAPEGTWYYRLKQIDLDGSVHYSDPSKIDVGAVGTAQDAPAVFSLGQNFPNPFNPETTIRYGLPSRSHVVLAVYNMLGERVALLAEGEQESGFHQVRFDGSALSSGVYFYRLQSAGFTQTRKLSLLK
jgi:hypothetical protein